jgi:phenylpropionate dioxygenase-like ring-hydroxylating dioxygenase large terminal subunit
MYGGWYLVAFENELAGSITAGNIGDMPLMLVCDGDRIRAFDAICPHRGANLAIGGRLDASTIICPFHGKRIFLGEQNGACYHVREYPVLGYGGMFFVRYSNNHENGLEALLQRLAEDHVFIPCYALPMRVQADVVTENAFDETHFKPVHGIRNESYFTVRHGEEGTLIAETSFELPVNQWQLGSGGSATVHVSFTAYAFSPHLVASHLGGDHAYWTITGATPTPAGGCIVRFGLAVPSGRGSGQTPSQERIQYLARQSRGGIEQDQVVWENLHRLAKPRYGPEDAAVIQFRNYCERFQTK